MSDDKNNPASSKRYVWEDETNNQYTSSHHTYISIMIISLLVLGVAGLIWHSVSTPRLPKTLTVTQVTNSANTTHTKLLLTKLVNLDLRYKSQTENTVLTNDKYQKQRTTLIKSLGKDLQLRSQNMEAEQTYQHRFSANKLVRAKQIGYLTIATYENDLYVNHLEQRALSAMMKNNHQTSSIQASSDAQLVLQHQATIIESHLKVMHTWVNSIDPDIDTIPYVALNPMIVQTDYTNAYFNSSYDSPNDKRNEVMIALMTSPGPSQTSPYGPYLNPQTGKYIEYHANTQQEPTTLA